MVGDVMRRDFVAIVVKAELRCSTPMSPGWSRFPPQPISKIAAQRPRIVRFVAITRVSFRRVR